MMIPQQRLSYIDHLRGLMFLLLALDHSLHAYAYHWGKFWFFKDYDRSILCDALHMHNNSIIIPMLFFIVGAWVVPSLNRRGVFNYLKERFIKLGIPFIVGVPLIVPLLVYPRYETLDVPGISVYQFWTTVFFTERLQAGPFWVMYALFLYTLIVVVLVNILPWFFNGFCTLVRWMVAHPLCGFLIFGAFSSLILGISDLIWGAPWWIGFGGLFYLQGSRFMLQALYFFAGAAVGAMGLLYDQNLIQRLSQHWQKLIILTAVLGVAYIGYSLSFFEGVAYNNEIRYYFKDGGQWADAWPVIIANAPGVLLRTTLHGFFCLAQALTLIAIFARFVKTPTPLWTSLACNGYGLFILHEVIVVWLQYYLNGVELPILFKVCIVASIGISVAWLINDRILRRLPGVRRVVG